MSQRRLFAAALLLAAAGAYACDRSGRTDNQAPRAQTQPGAAGSQERPGERRGGGCGDLPKADDLRKWLAAAPGQGEAGGLFSGKYEWATVVDRNGIVCATAVGVDDKTAAWPGSVAISKAKAFTANAFSTDSAPMSTARLYTLSQPGHSLWGAGAGNPFNPECLVQPGDADGSAGKVCGGTIVFGGGVPLYKGATKVGGLGVSGDTPCADHEIAKRIRNAAGLNPPKGQFADDIWYTKADGPSFYAHPLCPNTFRNGQKIGDEAPAGGY
jgi:uncharacterized protein GlcG (DUF336 family)